MGLALLSAITAVSIGLGLVSLIAGILLYVIVREFLPEKKEGRPLYFIIGIAVFMGISLLLNNSNH